MIAGASTVGRAASTSTHGLARLTVAEIAAVEALTTTAKTTQEPFIVLCRLLVDRRRPKGDPAGESNP